MHLGIWELDDYFSFHVNTHDMRTGAAKDADSDPTFRIYECGYGASDTPVYTGTMDVKDDSNTVGFYTSDEFQLSGANGFNTLKNYVIRVEATVNGFPSVRLFTFTVNTMRSAINTANANVYSMLGEFTTYFQSSLMYAGTIAGSMTSQTVFRLTSGSGLAADDDAYNGYIMLIVAAGNPENKAVVEIQDFDGSFGEITLVAASPVFTFSPDDTVFIFSRKTP